MGNEQIERVTEFQYLGSVIASSGGMQPDVDRRIALAALRKPVFNNRDLRLVTKRKVYQACVLSVLLYCSGADPGWGPRGPGPPPSRCAWPFPKRAHGDY